MGVFSWPMRTSTIAALVALLGLVGCTTAPVAGDARDITTASEPPHASPTAPAPSNDPEAYDHTPQPVPWLTIDRTTTDGRGRFHVRGKLENAKLPAHFVLREELGCRSARKLTTLTTGIGWDVALTASELTDALGCSIEARLGDDALDQIMVTPTATVMGSPRITLDADPTVASLEPEEKSPDIVRLTLRATEKLVSPKLVVAGATFSGVVSDEEGHLIVFELPAEAWSNAVIGQASFRFEARGIEATVRPGIDASTVIEEGC